MSWANAVVHVAKYAATVTVIVVIVQSCSEVLSK